VPDDRRSRSSGYPPLGGYGRAAPVRSRAAASSVRSMDRTRTRDDAFADLDLFLRESDREDPILPEVRDDGQEPEEELNSRILAGLVSP
jgi:hypothetical protein